MILVTGATGNVGSEVVRFCERDRVPCIAAGRRNVWHNHEKVQYRYLDLNRPESYNALEGVTRVFLMRPPQMANIKKTIAPFLRRCRECGVEKIVFLSLLGADRVRFVPHYAVEKEIVRQDIPHTFLRAGFFMQNLSTTHAEEIRERNELAAPCGNGKTTFVHVRDIADIGYRSLTDHLSLGDVDVAGDDTLTYGQVAEKLSRVLGRTITYRSLSPLGFIRYRLRHGTSLKFAFVMTGVYLPTRFGGAAYHGPGIAQHLGRPPLSFDQFLEEDKRVWLR